MSEKTWQDERRAACETGSRCIEEGPERSQSDGSSRDGALQSPAEEDTMRRRQVDNTAKADVLTACDTIGTADTELTCSEARDAHTHRVGDASVYGGYKLTAASGEDAAEEGIYTACDDVVDQKKKSADVIRTDT